MIEAPLAHRTGDILAQDQGTKLYQQLEVVDVLPRYDYTFPQVQDLLINQIHTGVPGELAKQLVFARLSWHLIASPDGLDFLLCGTESELSRVSNQDLLSSASATILVTRRVRENGKVYNESLKIAGLSLDSTNQSRIVAVDYNIRLGRAQRINVSLTQDEVKQVEDDTYFRYAVVRAPTAYDNTERTAALVTQGMIDQCYQDMSPEVLLLQIHDASGLGFDLQTQFSTDEPSFKVISDGSKGDHIVQFTPALGSKRAPWQIPVARHLPVIR